MKSFIIINGTSAFFINAEDMQTAKDHAIAICNHSLEIIVREIKMTDLVTKKLRDFLNDSAGNYTKQALLKDLDENWDIGLYTKEEYQNKRNEILFT